MKWLPPDRAARLGGPLVSLLARTWRFEVRHAERWRALVDRGRPFVFLLWHEVLLPLLWHHRRQGVAIVVSDAQEGRTLALYARQLGYRELHGSSTRGGVRALLAAVRALEGGAPVAFTPDGPKGPRRVLKPGAVQAAQRAGAPILPIHADANWSWRLSSWDQFLVPKPFAQVVVEYGAPLEIAPGDAGLSEGLARAARALAALAGDLACPDAGATATV